MKDRAHKTAEFVKKTRLGFQLTQEAFAALTHTTRASISSYERGMSIPPGDYILDLITLRKKNKNKFS